MSPGRIDELLEQALASGSVPADATEAERAEVEALLGTMGTLRATRGLTASEAAGTMPTARARFERYVARRQHGADARAGAVEPTRPRAGILGRLLGGHGVLALAGSAASVAVIGLVAVLLWQLAFQGPTSAYARMVDPGDYVQVEGVVEDSSGDVLELKSELGNVEVELSDTTTLVEASAAQDISTLKRGDRVLVGGIAGDGRRLSAQTLALTGAAGEPAPKVITFTQLERLRPNLEGRVVTYTISNDGTRGAVLIDAGDGERYLVRVDGKSAEQLLARASTALGQRVKVQEGSGVTSGTFSLEVPATTEPDPPKPAFVSVRGVVTNVQARPSSEPGRILDGVVTVQTLRGPVTVIVRPTTRVFPGESGLTPGAGLRGEAIGHTIAISGGIDRKTGNVVADVIVMGPKPERPAR